MGIDDSESSCSEKPSEDESATKSSSSSRSERPSDRSATQDRNDSPTEQPTDPPIDGIETASIDDTETASVDDTKTTSADDTDTAPAENRTGDDAQSIEEMLLEFDDQKGLIRERSLLDPNYIVEEDRIVGRDRQLQEVTKMLRVALGDNRPPNLFLYGPSGTGKSLITKAVCKNISRISYFQAKCESGDSICEILLRGTGCRRT